MKILLTILLLSLLPFAAHAEKIRPAGWSENGNNQDVGNRRVAGNRIWTKEEMKAKQASESGTSSSWFADGKPTITTKNGETSIKRVLRNKLGRQNADAILSNFNE